MFAVLRLILCQSLGHAANAGSFDVDLRYKECRRPINGCGQFMSF